MKNLTFQTAFAFFLFSLAGSPSLAQQATVTPEAIQQEIAEFAQIDPGLYRGAQPSDRGLELLKEFGIKTIINFRHEEDIVERERIFVEKLGDIDYLSIPWRIQLHPENQPMRRFLDHMQTAEKPVFIHCRRGAERTGVADTIYRHYSLNLPRSEAFEKAMKGFNTKWIWRPFIKKRVKDFYRDLGPAK